MATATAIDIMGRFDAGDEDYALRLEASQLGHDLHKGICRRCKGYKNPDRGEWVVPFEDGMGAGMVSGPCLGRRLSRAEAPAARWDKKQLSAMSKAELVELARTEGMPYPDVKSKADLIKRLTVPRKISEPTRSNQ